MHKALMLSGAAVGALLWSSLPAVAQQQAQPASDPVRAAVVRYYSSEAATAPAPAAGVPPLPKWSLKAPGTKPVMGSVVAQKGLSGPNVFDFEKLGYVEEEYFLSGTGNLYTVGGQGVVKGNVPYTTRILVRRPKDAQKFSGNVIIEPSRDVNEWTTLWPSAARHMLAHGDIFVAFTMAKDNLPTFFKGYDADRYGALDISDDGLRWDIMAQSAGLMRSADGPLAKIGFLDAAAKKKGGLKVISTGTSLTGGMQGSFIDYGHHARARRADGGPVMDGYLQLVSGRPQNLPADAPVIALISEGDAMNLLNRRVTALRAPDSDGPVKFRWYEIAGTAHANWDDQSQFTPAFQLIGLGEKSTPRCEVPVSEVAIKVDFVSAALANLEAWLRDGTAPPPGKVLDLAEDQSVKRDAYGNALGGLRPYWVEMPSSKVVTRTEEQPGADGVRATGGLCSMLASEHKLPKDQLAKLYRSHDEYVAKVDAYLKKQVADRYLLPEGAARQLAQAKAAAVP